MFRSTQLCLLAFLLVVPQVIFADTITVRKDGTGDHLTIAAAVAAASTGDEIEIGPGTYAEGALISIDLPLSLISTHGPELTVLDGSDLHRILTVTASSVEITGLAFHDGNSGQTVGGAIAMPTGSGLTLEDCHFESNDGFSGGALYVSGIGTTFVARRCSFADNVGTETGGAISVVLDALANFEDCLFKDNATGIKGGAIWSFRATTDCSGSVFLRNVSGDVAGALYHDFGGGTIQGNTFVDNTSPGAISGSVTVVNSPGSQILRNVFVGDTAGHGLRLYQSSSSTHVCNVYWNNAQGGIGGAPLGPDELEADPIFCDAAMEDFSLAANSPAAAANSACGQLVGALPVGCDAIIAGIPEITSIQDIPDDDGWQVRIEWERSSYDAPGEPFVITEYGIYRRERTAKAAAISGAAKSQPSRLPGVALDGWDFVAAVPARGDAIYQFVAPTLCNTLHTGPPRDRECLSVFFVSAMTADPLTFFDSEPDSGFSSDDIPPSAPRGLRAEHVVNGMELTWNAPEDVDVAAYRVYRGQGSGFEMSEATLVQSLKTTHWVDTSPDVAGASYQVTAVDESGQEGAAAFAQIAGPQPQNRFALYQNSPNPFNPTTQIYYDVPAGGGRVSIVIFDGAGRRVRTLRNGFEAAGIRKSVEWNGLTNAGDKVASGIYFYRLQAPDYERTLRMVLVE